MKTQMKIRWKYVSNSDENRLKIYWKHENWDENMLGTLKHKEKYYESDETQMKICRKY